MNKFNIPFFLNSYVFWIKFEFYMTYLSSLEISEQEAVMKIF